MDHSYTEFYTLSLHDALPIFPADFESSYLANSFQVAPEPHPVRLYLNIAQFGYPVADQRMFFTKIDDHCAKAKNDGGILGIGVRSEEHTSELQSRSDLVCRLL